MTDVRRPYRLRSEGNRLFLEGPLNQPADIRDIPDPDGFVEFLNDVYEKGFERGFGIRGDPDEYEAYERGRIVGFAQGIDFVASGES